MATNDGVFFVEPDHPVCSQCVSSLYRDEQCFECGGDGWVESETDDWDEEHGGIATCHECFGLPAGWHCPTCKRHWDFHRIEAITPKTDPEGDR